MKKITAGNSASSAMAQGQTWTLADSKIQIGFIGKRLVHYKHFKGVAKRANNSLASIPVLEKYLTDNKAVLQAK